MIENRSEEEDDYVDNHLNAFCEFTGYRTVISLSRQLIGNCI